MSLLQMNLSGGVMILAVIVIRAVALDLLPKKTFHALWCLVLLRLFMPFSVPAPFSVYSALPHSLPASVGPSGLGNTMFAPVLPMGLPSGADTLPPQTAGGISPYVLIWLVGLAVSATFFMLSYLTCRREFRESLPVPSGFPATWLSAHKLARQVETRQSDRITAPLTYGVFRPIILMPKHTVWDDTTQLSYILTHEWVHIRRFDAVLKLLLTAALCIHWFNPLVWTMCLLANRDMELSCDEAVVRLLGEPAKSAYARTLIRMEEQKSSLNPLCSHFNQTPMEARIKAIMKTKKTSIAAALTAIGLIIGVAAAFGTSAATVSQASPNMLDSTSLELISAEVAQSIAPYAPLGITYELDSVTGQAAFFWHGTQIKGIFDETQGTWISNSAGMEPLDANAKEVIAVYTGGELSGLRAATPQEQAQWDNIRRQNTRSAGDSVDNLRQEPYGTEADYASLLQLKTADYQNQSVQAFNLALMAWCTDHFDSSERISTDTAMNDVQALLTNEELAFAQLTAQLSRTENTMLVQSERTGKPRSDSSIRLCLEKDSSDMSRIAFANLDYTISYHITDETRLTVADRDRAIADTIQEIQVDWENTDIDTLLAMDQEDFITHIGEIGAKYSTALIQISSVPERTWFDGMSEPSGLT